MVSHAHSDFESDEAADQGKHCEVPFLPMGKQPGAYGARTRNLRRDRAAL
jgi:hypothetical protein